MVDVITLGIILVVLLGAGAFFILIIVRRQKAIKVVVIELRNPNAKSKKYYAIYDKVFGRWNLFTMLVNPFKAGIMYGFDAKPFLKDGAVTLVRGASDHPDDSMLVPVHPYVIGQAGIRQELKEMKDGIIDVLLNGQAELKDKDGTIIQAKIEGIGGDGLAEKLDALITQRWVALTFGIVPVEDVNVILDQEKQGIADFNSNINEKVKNKQSFWKRNQELMVFAGTMFILIIGALILWSQLSHPTGSGSAVSAITSAINSTTHTTLPAVTTPAPNISH